jgi:hypothetical protein
MYQSGCNAHERRFACSVFSNHAMDFAGTKGKAHVIEGTRQSVVLYDALKL